MLIVIPPEFERIELGDGDIFTLSAKTYTNPDAFDGNGAAASVIGGTLTGAGTSAKRIVFADNCVVGTNLGGAIYADKASSVLDLDYTDFSGNTASAGGAVYQKSGSMTLDNVRFLNNTGGALFIGGTARLTDVLFSGNVNSGAAGGGLINSGTVTLAGVTFSGNSASAGGAVSNRGILNIAGAVTLSAGKDTIANTGTMVWDLSVSSTRKSVTVNGYSRLYNNGGKLNIKVSSGNMVGSYTLATGVTSSLSGKNSFTVTGIGSSTAALTVGGAKVVYGSYVYTLKSQSGKLVLDIAKNKARSDFNLTGKSDVLQVKNQKITVAYDVNGKYTVSKTLCNLGKWQVLTKEGDNNGDGRSDCLITLNNGSGVMNVSTLLNTGKSTSSISFKRSSILNLKLSTWTCLGGGDLNGDGISDVVILQTQKSAGKKSRAIQVMLLNSKAKISKKVKAGSVNSNWEVIGFADVDGNGTDNVIIRHKTGVIGYWKELDNPKVVTLRSAANYTYLGAGDFDGDGADELLWKNTKNNSLVEWDKAASSSLKEINLGKLSAVSGWNFNCIGDYDGDARDELSWCSTNGKRLGYSEAQSGKIGKITVIV